MRTVTIPDFALVVVIGSSADAATRFARRHFRGDEVVAPSPTPRTAAGGSMDCHGPAAERLRRRRLAVLPADDSDAPARRDHVRLARCHHALPVALVTEAASCRTGLRKEGFRVVHHVPEEAAGVAVRRQPLWSDLREQAGPFDIIGDVHGCADELELLLDELGYRVRFRDGPQGRECEVVPPPGRTAVFVGDLVDRGPRVADVLRLVMSMTAAGTALCVAGNHDDKLLRWLRGGKVKINHGLDASIAQLEPEPADFRDRVARFLARLPDHCWLDDGRLCVAHAGLTEALIGRASGAVRSFALYGETTGERDRYGLPVRGDWPARYRGETRVVYGHTPVLCSRWRNNTLCLDTGCVFGGSLTALRYPEDELVSVPALHTYFEPLRPFGTR